MLVKMRRAERSQTSQPSTSQGLNASSSREYLGSNQLSDALHFGMKSITGLSQDILPLCDPEDRAAVSKQFDTKFKTLVKAELLYQQSSEMVNGLFMELDGMDENADEKTILKSLNDVMNESQKQRVAFGKKISNAVIKRNARYMEFNELVSSAIAEIENEESTDSDDDSNDPDSDAEMEGSDTEATVTDIVPIVDPLSKEKLTDPVRNKICNHIYGKKAMVALIKQTNKVRCPTLGCANHAFIRVQDLVNDPELARKVRQRLKKEKKLQNKQ